MNAKALVFYDPDGIALELYLHRVIRSTGGTSGS